MAQNIPQSDTSLNADMNAFIGQKDRFEGSNLSPLQLKARVFFSHSSLLLFALTQVTAGVLRWGFGSISLQSLIYIPTLLVLTDVALVALEKIRERKLSRATLALCCLLANACLVGILSLPISQVAFGAWVLTPVIYGYACSERWALWQPNFRYAALALMCIACIGIIGNTMINYPWIGANFELAGKNISGAREWHIGERQRLAGFSRSSFDAAAQIVLLAAIFNAGESRRLLRIVVWIFAASAVILSTARGIVLAMLVVAFATECSRLRWQWGSRAAVAIGILWATMPPLISWMFNFKQEARLQLHSSHGSYLDRLANMWPNALKLLQESAVPPLGRGIGGIGAAQTLFEPRNFNAADNLMVYHIVTLGAIALPICFVFAAGAWRSVKEDWIDATALRSLALIVLWYGAVSNIVENPFLAIAYGICLSRGLSLFTASHTYRNKIKKRAHSA